MTLKKSIQRDFKGLAISPGKVLARVCLYSTQAYKEITETTVTSEIEKKSELERFQRAIDGCMADLERTKKNAAEQIGEAEAEIFTTQQHILSDPAICDAVREHITKKHKNLESAVISVYSDYEAKFARLDNEYIKQRISDITEIKHRIINWLYDRRAGFKCQGQHNCSRGADAIIVARELTAEMMVHMKLEEVRGIVTEQGGISSHAAIIARSVGIPAVSGVRGILGAISCGSQIYVDGDNGLVLTNPDDETVQAIKENEPVLEKDIRFSVTPPGKEILANVSLLEDVRHAVQVNADGIGLFRTEIYFMRAKRLLSEQEQYEYYAQAMKQMNGKTVTFRLLDVGGDKELPFLRREKEDNPFLGWRGSRFLLGNQEIFATQVRALLRLSNLGKIKLLFPMVVDVGQVRKLIEGIRELAVVVGVKPENISIGVMFEIPSACLQAVEILKEIDFASIGSNDLIQYLFAVDRNNVLVSQDYNPNHPVLWNLLKNLSEAAELTERPLSICGEMASRENMSGKLFDIGINSLSVSPRLVPRVRKESILYLNEKESLHTIEA